MTIPHSVAEILKQHFTLEVEGIDRMYLNVYVPRLQVVEGVLGFIRRHRGHRVASTRMVEPITRQFVAAMEEFVHNYGLPLVSFDKGQRKEEVAARFLTGFSKPEGVVFVGKAQEKCTVYRTERRRNPRTGKTYAWIDPPPPAGRDATGFGPALRRCFNQLQQEVDARVMTAKLAA